MRKLATLVIGIAVSSFAYAAKECPISWTGEIGYGAGVRLGVDTIVFTPLRDKILTTQELETFYKDVNQGLIDAKSTGYFASGQYFTKTDDGRRRGELYASGRPAAEGNANRSLSGSQPPQGISINSTTDRDQWVIQLAQGRLAAYECHRNQGWPSATDYVAPSKASAAKDSSGQSAERSRNEAKRLDDKQEANLSAILEQGEEVMKSEANRSNGPRNQVFLPQKSQCLRVIDVAQDKTVKSMYWYAIQNTCKEPLQAYWCAGEKSDCKQPKQAAVIKPGGKERSWMDSSTGKQGVQFYGTACSAKFKGRQVYYDKQRAECWALDSD